MKKTDLIVPLVAIALLLPGCSGDSQTTPAPTGSASPVDSRPLPSAVQLAYLTQWGSSGSNDGEFAEPSGVAVDTTDQKVFVADTGNSRIQVFDYSGNFLFKWGAPGLTTPYLGATFASPKKVEYDKVSDRLLVFDEWNKRVVVFTGGGAFITYAEHASNGAEALGAGSVNSADGKIYATDPLSSSIMVLDIGGGLLETWDLGNYESRGTGYDPYNGRIYASAYGGGGIDDYVLVIDSSGSTIGQIARFRNDNGICTATDVEVDPRTGMVFTLEYARIQVVDRNYGFLTDRGGLDCSAVGSQAGQLNNPRQMSYDPDSKLLFVADTDNDRIQVFQVIY